jgi:hypothetical protein
MKRIAICTLALCLAITLIDSLPAFGQERQKYVAFKAGSYTPTGDLDELDSGFAGEVVLGHYYRPTLALEGGIGHFETDASFTETIPFFGIVDANIDVSVTTISLTVKGLHPIEIGELYMGFGIGIGLVDVDIDASTGLGPVSESDDDTSFGFQLLAGANFNITEKCFLGVEGKYYITVDEPEILGLEADADGFIITGVLGFRF